MSDCLEQCLEAEPNGSFCVGQIVVQRSGVGFVLCHRDDQTLNQLQIFRSAENAIEIAKYDDAGNYRPLKTAPNLRHGWRMELDTPDERSHALDYFYPGRLAVFAAWKNGVVKTTALRETLARQSGMYRIAAKISDSQIDDVVSDFCRSNGGCLRTILWKRDADGAIASTKLPNEKFDTGVDQTLVCSRRAVGDARASHSEAATIPLLCQEACNLLVAECRKLVKGDILD